MISPNSCHEMNHLHSLCNLMCLMICHIPYSGTGLWMVWRGSVTFILFILLPPVQSSICTLILLLQIEDNRQKDILKV